LGDRQEDSEFKASLRYIERPHPKKKKPIKKCREEQGILSHLSNPICYTGRNWSPKRLNK
jgi:hypothetical protein